MVAVTLLAVSKTQPAEAVRAAHAAGVAAMLVYVPWIPQVLSSIDAANQVERRESYLGVDWSRIGTTLLALYFSLTMLSFTLKPEDVNQINALLAR